MQTIKLACRNYSVTVVKAFLGQTQIRSTLNEQTQHYVLYFLYCVLKYYAYYVLNYVAIKFNILFNVINASIKIMNGKYERETLIFIESISVYRKRFEEIFTIASRLIVVSQESSIYETLI